MAQIHEGMISFLNDDVRTNVFQANQVFAVSHKVNPKWPEEKPYLIDDYSIVGKWYFLDETGDSYGPYDTSDEAVDGLQLYCDTVLEGKPRQEDSREANHIDGYDRDDLGEFPDF